jgi:hypothetical protein
VDLRHYIDRLNEVAGPDWSDEYQVQDGGKVVVCRLTIGGITRSDVGEAKPNDENTATTALAQAFKRACVKFGLGAYLYRLPRTWVPYDPQRRRFTHAALTQLQQEIAGGNGSHRADTSEPDPVSGSGNGGGDINKATSTEFWHEVNRLGVPREVALGIAKSTGSWGQKVAALGS